MIEQGDAENAKVLAKKDMGHRERAEKRRGLIAVVDRPDDGSL